MRVNPMYDSILDMDQSHDEINPMTRSIPCEHKGVFQIQVLVELDL
jgi:hypothetical protein